MFYGYLISPYNVPTQLHRLVMNPLPYIHLVVSHKL